MLEVLKLIKEKEKEASRIIEEAKLQADRIYEEAKAKAGEVYNQAYEQRITEARNKSLELERKARDALAQAQEAKGILRKTQNQIKHIHKKAEENFEEAIDAALSEIIS